MPQSPELAGGEGFTFEGNVAAYYLVSLLAEASAPGIDDRRVVRVSVQQRDFGEPLDDVIVDFEDTSAGPARLSLQVKRSLTISGAKSNSDFRDIIRDSWATLKKPSFCLNVDRYGAAVDTISAARAREIRTLCDFARESLTADHFGVRLSTEGSASGGIRTVYDDIVTLLNEVNGTSCTNEDIHIFLGHFVLIEFDFLREGATNPPEAMNRLRDCLAPDAADQAPLVWARLVQMARAAAGKSGQFDRARLVRSVAPVARLRGATSLRQNLDILIRLAKSNAGLIPDDIGGIRLDRPTLLEELNAKLTSAPVVQILGLPGSGKSVVMKRAVQRALDRGPVLFLKAEQLEGANWISYARSLGLSDVSLDKLLVEIGATGSPILFIDAIDRIEKTHQPIILDLIQAIKKLPLDGWRVVFSLRDTGVGALRNWLGDFIDAVQVKTLGVKELDDDEARILANSKPLLQPLLFGSSQVRDIVRRPFFAKMLDQSYTVILGNQDFVPTSELDLIENWWKRGGYDDTGQRALERQRALLDLARVHARKLNEPIRLSELANVDRIGDIEKLRSDGILQNVREGLSVRFTHDIFFEWSFFHVLADCNDQLLEEIKACGEPPALARVVELVSQWEYMNGREWRTRLEQTESSGTRSQWLRAWLAGPLGTAQFVSNEDQFVETIFADDFRLLRKLLVWFQAEKSVPNAVILASALPLEERQRGANLLSWPSDFPVWLRLISFILRRASDIPPKIYPEIITIFQVWQNALFDHVNPTSHALLRQCSAWLASIDMLSASDRESKEDIYWRSVPGLHSFQQSLAHLIMRSSKAEPTFAAEYLQGATDTKSIRGDAFHDILTFAPVLAQSLPRLLVDYVLSFLCRELPDEQVARVEQERRQAAKWRKEVLAKPEAERTRLEEMMLSHGAPLRTIGDFDHFEWERLSIHDDHHSFWPPSPLREPFHSLFQSSPDQALRLLRELCNHAMAAWRQLHHHSGDPRGRPIPLELTFPWGNQQFWGTEREYLWCRATWAPKAIGCGFMALEEWCFAELERDRPVDDLIQQIIFGNECIAILGVASMVALHTQRISEATFPLFTSQRLLSADYNRMIHDISPTASLIGFNQPADMPHIEAIQKFNDRPVRKNELKWMAPGFVFAKGSTGARAKEAILNFKNNLPFQHEGDSDNPDVQRQLTSQALEYAELADPHNYQAYLAGEDSGQVAIVHVSPSATKPERVALVEKSSKLLRQCDLFPWASKSLEEMRLNEAFTVEAAIILAKEADVGDLFKHPTEESEEGLLSRRRGAVAATAATVLTFREGRSQEDLEWARNVLDRAVRLPERFAPGWSPDSMSPLHQAIFVAKGLAADIREGTAAPGTERALLGLISHPHHAVSLSALHAACALWSKDPKLSWAALILAFSFCHVPQRPRGQTRHPSEPLHSADEAQAKLDSAVAFYESGSEWPPLPLPPPAWILVEPGQGLRWHQRYGGYEARDVADVTKDWAEPDVFWHSEKAAKVLQSIPIATILDSHARHALLDFFASVLDWTNQKIAPPWVKPGRSGRHSINLYDWTHALGSRLGFVAGILPLSDFEARFLDPILALEGENCWTLLYPLTNTYVCVYGYDSPVVPPDAVQTLELCLGRLLQDSAFKRGTYRSGELAGFDLPRLVLTLMFVSVEHAGLAARYVNGDWSEIDRILPLIDRFIRAAGWAASVMGPFLTLCERAKTHYPAESFADQVLTALDDGPDSLAGWHGTLIPGRIAELVHHFAHRDESRSPTLNLKFLRIFDVLVDMGDRRSAALQLSEAFRRIRMPL